MAERERVNGQSPYQLYKPEPWQGPAYGTAGRARHLLNHIQSLTAAGDHHNARELYFRLEPLLHQLGGDLGITGDDREAYRKKHEARTRG